MKRKNREWRKYLNKNYAKTFAEQFNCSESKIFKVAAGTRKDTKILAALMEESEKNKLIEKQAWKLK